MHFSPPVSTIADTIQLSLSPVFMLAGIATLMNVLAGRLGRVIDRVRVLEELHPASDGDEHARYVAELRVLDRRLRLTNAALLLGATSAVVTCTTVALLFIAELGRFPIGRYVAAAFVLAMSLLITALSAFAMEVRVSMRSNRVRLELLERR